MRRLPCRTYWPKGSRKSKLSMADPTSKIAEDNMLRATADAPGQHLSGRQTAVILLMIFGENETADILSRLLPGEVQALGETMFEIRNVSEDEVNLVFDRFVEQ